MHTSIQVIVIFPRILTQKNWIWNDGERIGSERTDRRHLRPMHPILNNNCILCYRMWIFVYDLCHSHADARGAFIMKLPKNKIGEEFCAKERGDIAADKEGERERECTVKCTVCMDPTKGNEHRAVAKKTTSQYRYLFGSCNLIRVTVYIRPPKAVCL